MSDPVDPQFLPDRADPSGVVRAYHEATKHHYNRFARSLGHLDWASQPKAFRTFADAPRVTLHPAPGTEPVVFLPPLYDALFAAGSGAPPMPSIPTAPMSPTGPTDPPLPPSLAFTWPTLGIFLRHALGLSAWKAFGASRWALRVNPSSGNLHPTEAYVVMRGGVWHYMPDEHALEQRCEFAPATWDRWSGTAPGGPVAAVIVLTSVHWREAWKYGERAFRYCQHDVGHAIAALRLSAAMCGWQLSLAEEWTTTQLSTITGVDRDDDYVEAEREEPACALLLRPVDQRTATAMAASHGAASETGDQQVAALVAGVRDGRWAGRASQLSEDHVQWTFIDDVATASRRQPDTGEARWQAPLAARVAAGETNDLNGARPAMARAWQATTIVLQRRSAVAFDGMTSMSRQAFLGILARVMPGPHAPWDALRWPPRIHLVLFVHRVDDLDPGLYLLPRSDDGEALLRRAITRDFAWQPVVDAGGLIQLATGDCRRMAQRLSCDQAIAADGCFSLGMLADFEAALDTYGPAFYRRLFWESGVIGQVLYLEAEAAGLRGTGIGCFYDDGVHEVLGIGDRSVQSLYHFTVGGPVEDRRLSTEAGYGWEGGR